MASCVAFLPAPAWADDGDAAASASAAEPAATIELDTSLVDHAAEAVEETEDALEAVMAATPADGDAAGGDEAAGQTPAPTEPEPESEANLASTGGSEPDTTASSSDTATDSTASAPVGEGPGRTASSAPLTTPAAGTINVNVSVRIGSAGDDWLRLADRDQRRAELDAVIARTADDPGRESLGRRVDHGCE